MTSIITEYIPHCLICGGHLISFYTSLRDLIQFVPGCWNFSKCANCGSLWLNPRPVTEDILKCYGSDFYTHTPRPAPGLGSSPVKRLLRAIALKSCLGYDHLARVGWWGYLLGKCLMSVPVLKEKIMMGLGPMLLPFRPSGRLLDIGCGNGWYLALMRDLGWEVAGVEIDPESAAIARDHFGINVHIGALENAPFEGESFDAITMDHVIEHVPNPLHFLKSATYFLKPTGILVCRTPNVQSLGHRLWGKQWYYLHHPRHMVLFTPRSLRECFHKVRCFRHIKIYTTPRQTRRIFKMWVTIKKIGWFSEELASLLRSNIWVRLSYQVFNLTEKLGNSLFQWGEEIVGIGIKQDV